MDKNFQSNNTEWRMDQNPSFLFIENISILLFTENRLGTNRLRFMIENNYTGYLGSLFLQVNLSLTSLISQNTGFYLDYDINPLENLEMQNVLRVLFRLLVNNIKGTHQCSQKEQETQPTFLKYNGRLNIDQLTVILGKPMYETCWK